VTSGAVVFFTSEDEFGPVRCRNQITIFTTVGVWNNAGATSQMPVWFSHITLLHTAPGHLPLSFSLCVSSTLQVLIARFPLIHSSITPASSLCSGVFSPQEYSRYSQGQQKERRSGSFIILSTSIPSLLSFSLAQVCFILGLRNQTTRLQRGKEIGLMSLTSEDAFSVIKEV